jgi:AcrR family transcriptional regulator
MAATTAESRAGRRGPGRPRSTTAKAAILQAARELLDERGLKALTVEAIASRAGASKATIYRWWPNKSAVVMDAFLAGTSPRMPFPDTGSVREDLRRQLRSVIRLFNEPGTRGPFVALIAESQHDQEVARALRERFIAARRAAAREVFERGQARGELRADLDIDIANDALYGALYYRLLVSGAPLRPRYADALLDQFYDAMSAG